MATKKFNSKENSNIFKAAKVAVNDLLRSPLAGINVLNSAAFKTNADIKAALKVTGASKWSFDVMARTAAGKVCKLVKAGKDYTFEGDVPCIYVGGTLYKCIVPSAYSVAFLLESAKSFVAANEAAKAAAAKAEKAAKAKAAKAEKAAKGKAKEEACVEFLANLTAEQMASVMAMLAAKTANA